MSGTIHPSPVGGAQASPTGLDPGPVSRRARSSRARTVAKLLLAFPPGAAVSLYDAQIALGGDHQHVGAALALASVREEFQQLRAGQLWVRCGDDPDPYQVGARIISPYVFAYGTALAVHAGIERVGAEVLIKGTERFTAFTHAGITYRHCGVRAGDTVIHRPAKIESSDCPCPATVPKGGHCRFRRSRRHGPSEPVWVTTPERTFADCLIVPDRAGGLDTLLDASGHLALIDIREIIELVNTSTARSRLGLQQRAEALTRLKTMLEHHGSADAERRIDQITRQLDIAAGRLRRTRIAASGRNPPAVSRT